MKRKLAEFLGLVVMTVGFVHLGMFVVEQLGIFSTPEGRGVSVGILTGLLIGWLTEENRG